MPDKVKRLTLSVAEAAQELGISTRKVYDLTHQQGFPVLKIGARTRIPRAGLEEWVASNGTPKGGAAT